MPLSKEENAAKSDKRDKELERRMKERAREFMACKKMDKFLSNYKILRLNIYFIK